MSALHILASTAATAIYDQINGVDGPEALDHLARLLWRAFGEGAIGEGDAAFLQSCIDRRRPLGRTTAPGFAKPLAALNRRVASRFTPRQRARSPDRKASLDRRRMLGGSGALPANMRHHYTLAQMSVLTIVAGEVNQHGICDLPIDRIAALAGTCRTTVQTTMHEARRVGHIKITERPVPGRKSLPNLVEITSPEWLAWIKRGPTSHRSIGSNFAKMVSPTKIKDLKKEEAAEENRQWRCHGPPPRTSRSLRR